MRTVVRTSILVFALGLMALALMACASAPIVPVEGSMEDLSDLAGEWSGTYVNPDLRREGTIWFKLTPGETSARGDVRMTPRTKVNARTEGNPGAWRELQPVEYLDIRFVRVSANNIFGELNRYWDPDAGCSAVTVFRGRLFDGRLLGTFTTRFATGDVVAGRWEAIRK